MAAVAQRSMPLQPGAPPQLCAARPDPFQQALIVCPPAFQGEFHTETPCGVVQKLDLFVCLFIYFFIEARSICAEKEELSFQDKNTTAGD